MMDALLFQTNPDDAPFQFLLDMFLRAESLACFSSRSDEEEINETMQKMASGLLAPDDVQELFGKLRSDPAAVARLASLLQESKRDAREASE
jgi:DnaJ-domain-containing protein 1